MRQRTRPRLFKLFKSFVLVFGLTVLGIVSTTYAQIEGNLAPPIHVGNHAQSISGSLGIATTEIPLQGVALQVNGTAAVQQMSVLHRAISLGDVRVGFGTPRYDLSVAGDIKISSLSHSLAAQSVCADAQGFLVSCP